MLLSNQVLGELGQRLAAGQRSARDELIEEIKGLEQEQAFYRLWVEKWFSVDGKVIVTSSMLDEERELVAIYLHFRGSK